MRRGNGSVQSYNTPTYDNAGRTEENTMLRCMVIGVTFSDDSTNITKNSINPRVLYKVVVLGGFRTGQIISNCRLASHLGGINNYYERVLRPSSKNVSTARLSEHDGDVVYVQFVQGHTGFPVITFLDNGINTKDNIGAKKSDGTRSKSQFNGVYEEINKNGEWYFTRKGGTLDEKSGVFTPAESSSYEARLYFTENLMVWEDPNTSITFKKNEALWQHIVGKTDNVYTETIDGKAEKTTKAYKSGLKVEEDGANDVVTVTTNSGAKLTIDGQNDTVEIKDNDSGKLKITGNTVALGASGIELLQQISDQLNFLIQWANNVGALHDHLGNLGYPTAVPTQTADYIQLGSDLAGVKANVDSIKGSL